MSIEKEILDSIAILIKKYAESNTQIYIGTVTNLNGNKCSMLLNGKVLESVRVYGATPPVGAILPVFVPSGNFNVAFTMYMQGSGGSSTVGAVTSVAGKTGDVTLTKADVGDGSTYVRTHNDFTDASKAQISTNATNISSKQAKITASGILKGDGNGGVSTAISGTDYAAANLLVVSNTQPTSQPTGGVWYKLGKVLS